MDGLLKDRAALQAENVRLRRENEQMQELIGYLAEGGVDGEEDEDEGQLGEEGEGGVGEEGRRGDDEHMGCESGLVVCGGGGGDGGRGVVLPTAALQEQQCC